MTAVVQHVDSYGQRYVTTTEQVLIGVQYTTEIYIPFVYGEELQTRRLENSVEVYGTVGTIVQILDHDGQNSIIVAEDCEYKKEWIEVWKKYSQPHQNRFKHTLDCSLVSVFECNINQGPAFVDPDGTNETYWSDIDTNGDFIPNSISNSTDFFWIDVWS